MAANAAEIRIAIEAQTAELRKGFKSTETAVDRLSQKFSKAKESVKAWGAALSGLRDGFDLVAGGFRSLNSIFAEVQQNQRQALALDIDLNQLNRLRFIARATGVEFETLSDASIELGQRIGEAIREPTSTTGEAFKRLGQDAGILVQLPIEERWIRIGEAFQNAENNAQGLFDLSEILGDQYRELTPILKASREELEELARAGTDLDSAFDPAQLKEYNRGLAEMEMAWNKVSIAVVKATGDVLKWYRTRYTDDSKEAQANRNWLTRFFLGMPMFPGDRNYRPADFRDRLPTQVTGSPEAFEAPFLERARQRAEQARAERAEMRRMLMGWDLSEKSGTGAFMPSIGINMLAALEAVSMEASAMIERNRERILGAGAFDTSTGLATRERGARSIISRSQDVMRRQLETQRAQLEQLNKIEQNVRPISQMRVLGDL